MEHPITPPPELVQQWINEEDGLTAGHIAAQAARWGADQELEACCEWLRSQSLIGGAVDLRDARRPKPLSEADQALADLDALVADLSNHGMGFKATNVRRALERLKKLEALPND